MAKTQPPLEDQKPLPGDLSAFANATNIDRRTCKRVVPLRVLALGPSRSGTSSLRQALIDLGYKDCYHYTTPLQENPRDQEMWNAAYAAKFTGVGEPFTLSDWDQLLGHCQAITDSPCVIFYRELLAAYPEAKVILTVRDDVDQWFDSMMATIIPYVEDVCTPAGSGVAALVYRWFTPLDARFYRFIDYQLMSPMCRALVEDYRRGTQTAKQWYLDYIEEVKALVPRERLLVMNVKEGWEPLCRFLGHEVPEYPFPRKNDTEAFKRNTAMFGGFVREVVKWNVMKTVGAVVTVGVAVAVGMYRGGLVQRMRFF